MINLPTPLTRDEWSALAAMAFPDLPGRPNTLSTSPWWNFRYQIEVVLVPVNLYHACATASAWYPFAPSPVPGYREVGEYGKQRDVYFEDIRLAPMCTYDKDVPAVVVVWRPSPMGLWIPRDKPVPYELGDMLREYPGLFKCRALVVPLARLGRRA